MCNRFWYSAGPRRKRFRCNTDPCIEISVCEVVSNNADPYTGSMGIHGSVLIESGPGIREIENRKLRRGVPLQIVTTLESIRRIYDQYLLTSS